MARTKEEALMIDHDAAKEYASSYIDDIRDQIIARGLILNGAIQEFNSFLNLPASSNLGAAIWDFAFGLLSTAVPALRLGEFIKTQHERAKVALNAAEIFAQKAKGVDKAKKAVTGALQTGGAIAKHVDDAKGLYEKAEKISKPEESLIEHASRKPIFKLIEELNSAKKMYKDAVKTERQEWINYVDDVVEYSPSKYGALEKKTKELLPSLPATLSDSDLKEIWTLYLFIMIVEHCKRNLKWKETITDYGYGQLVREVTLEGLNDTQIKQILDWFGPKAKRSKYFTKPMIININTFVGMFPIPTETKRKSETGWIRAKL